jgi:glyoxylase-like metal-dependent hydrolase (beta-lactamase superfamily II)
MTRFAFFLFLGSIVASAGTYAESVLKTERLADNVYALIGPTTDRDPQNLGNNANFGVVVTEEGVVLIDPGATHKGARMIHDAVRAITDDPIVLVIDTGGQDHRWLGNGYFKALGARIVANEIAVTDQKARLRDQLSRLGRLIGDDRLDGTEAVYADETFSDRKLMTIGGARIEIHHAGHAHTPGDSFVWLPDHKILFSGDIVYTDRLLSIGPQSAHRSWNAAFEAMAAMQPQILVGGHGEPIDLAKATAYTYDYLVLLRAAVRVFMDEGHGMEEIGKIDHSRFDYLASFD